MNKSDVIAEMHKELHETMTRQQCADALNTFLTITETALVRGEPVNLWHFGAFEVRSYGSRDALSPRTQEPIKIPESRRVAFRASKSLKRAIN